LVVAAIVGRLDGSDGSSRVVTARAPAPARGDDGPGDEPSLPPPPGAGEYFLKMRGIPYTARERDVIEFFTRVK
jgi:hypothetical protein